VDDDGGRDMHICLLTEQDLDALLPEDDWPCDPRPFLPEARWDVGVVETYDAVKRVIEFSRNGYDLFFNLCDGAWDEGRPGIDVVLALERLGLPFTGATSEFYEPSREAMKRVCRAWGIDTPGYVIASSDLDLERAADTLRFPLIAKHPSSYASIGLTRESRVETAAALFEQARRMMAEYGSALIEEFIDGIEATVLVAENADDPADPATYRPMRYEFPEGETFKHSHMKWVDYDLMKCFPVEDAELAWKLRAVSSRFFVGLNGTGYGRCDLRVDADGRPFMLEINPNCGVFYRPEDAGSADLCLLHEPNGHVEFTRRVVDAAFRRHALRERNWEVRPRPDGGYGIHATRAIAPGERILVFEERPHDLVTLSHVERTWDERRLSWFANYAWPLTEEVWVTWGRNPEDWKPVNHSCEPTAWLEGLDVVARLPLERGDEVTLDYATFYNERMPSFGCECGARTCRGVVRGDDYLRDFVARYGDHVSDYVRRKRAASL